MDDPKSYVRLNYSRALVLARHVQPKIFVLVEKAWCELSADATSTQVLPMPLQFFEKHRLTFEWCGVLHHDVKHRVQKEEWTPNKASSLLHALTLIGLDDYTPPINRDEATLTEQGMPSIQWFDMLMACHPWTLVEWRQVESFAAYCQMIMGDWHDASRMLENPIMNIDFNALHQIQALNLALSHLAKLAGAFEVPIDILQSTTFEPVLGDYGEAQSLMEKAREAVLHKHWNEAKQIYSDILQLSSTTDNTRAVIYSNLAVLMAKELDDVPNKTDQALVEKIVSLCYTALNLFPAWGKPMYRLFLAHTNKHIALAEEALFASSILCPESVSPDVLTKLSSLREDCDLIEVYSKKASRTSGKPITFDTTFGILGNPLPKPVVVEWTSHLPTTRYDPRFLRHFTISNAFFPSAFGEASMCQYWVHHLWKARRGSHAARIEICKALYMELGMAAFKSNHIAAGCANLGYALRQFMCAPIPHIHSIQDIVFHLNTAILSSRGGTTPREVQLTLDADTILCAIIAYDTSPQPFADMKVLNSRVKRHPTEPFFLFARATYLSRRDIDISQKALVSTQTRRQLMLNDVNAALHLTAGDVKLPVRLACQLLLLTFNLSINSKMSLNDVKAQYETTLKDAYDREDRDFVTIRWLLGKKCIIDGDVEYGQSLMKEAFGAMHSSTLPSHLKRLQRVWQKQFADGSDDAMNWLDAAPKRTPDYFGPMDPNNFVD